MPSTISDVAALPGLGPRSAALLARVGVRDRKALMARDAFALYAELRQIDPKTSLNMLYALLGAQQGVDWRTIARELRTDILNELDARAQHRSLPP